MIDGMRRRLEEAELPKGFVKDDLVALLQHLMKHKTPMSAAKLAKHFKTYPATIKRRIDMLLTLGAPLSIVKVREGERGFPSTAWTFRNG